MSAITVLRSAYEGALRLWGVGNGIPWTINGLKCRIDPSERHRASRVYEPVVADFLKSRIKPGMTFFDVGANVGVYVIQFAAWSAPSGQIVAFEPNPVARDVLERHVKMNGLETRVTVSSAAIGNRVGRTTLYASGADGMSRLGAPNKHLPETLAVPVEMSTVDEYVKSSGSAPDVLFIDIEGFEFQALAGAAELIKSKRDLLIVSEIHPNVWESADTTSESAARLLAELRLQAVALHGQRDPLNEYGTVWLQQLQ